MPTEPRPLRDVPPEPGITKPEPALVVDGVSKRFGGLLAVDVDHLEVQRHTITSLIGPNGAGKTTLFNLLTGFDQPDSGSVHFDEKELAGKAPHRIARTGVVRTFQLTKTLSRMSVIDNMMVGAPGQRGEGMLASVVPALWRAQETEVRARADELLSAFGLAHMSGQYAGSLSGGQRKLLELARALMADPAMVLLDEPMAGVNPALVQSLLDHVRALRDEGRTVLFIEHDMDVVMGISDWIVCMAEGQVIAEGPPDSVASNERVIDAYLGTQMAEDNR